MTTAVVTILLTVYLLGCAVRSLTRPMPALRTTTDIAHRAAFMAEDDLLAFAETLSESTHR